MHASCCRRPPARCSSTAGEEGRLPEERCYLLPLCRAGRRNDRSGERFTITGGNKRHLSGCILDRVASRVGDLTRATEAGLCSFVFLRHIHRLLLGGTTTWVHEMHGLRLTTRGNDIGRSRLAARAKVGLIPFLGCYRLLGNW